LRLSHFGLKFNMYPIIAFATSKPAKGIISIRSTLLYYTMDHEKLDDLVKPNLNGLIAKELIAVDSRSTYEAGRLSKAIVTSSFDP
jgi:hypothetical protein